jgi:hypothetical protein
MLKYFPEIEGPMECLKKIFLYYTGIEELPSSVGYLVGLKDLTIHATNNIFQLQHLKHLYQFDTGIVTLPRCIENFDGLKVLNLRRLVLRVAAIVSIPTWFNRFVGLRSLLIIGSIFRRSLSPTRSFAGWNGTSRLPLERKFQLECPFNSLELDLSGTAIVSIPTWFNRFLGLRKLDLSYCQLREILGLPPNVWKVCAEGCSSLEVFLEEARRSELFNTCVPPDPLRVGTVPPALLPLERKFQLECPFNSLELLDLSDSAIVSLPTFFNRFVKLEYLP